MFVYTSIFKNYETERKDIQGTYLKQENKINELIIINMTMLKYSNILFAF